MNGICSVWFTMLNFFIILFTIKLNIHIIIHSLVILFASTPIFYGVGQEISNKKCNKCPIIIRNKIMRVLFCMSITPIYLVLQIIF